MSKKRKLKKETVKKFAVYEKGIGRLGELKKQLDKLDTGKFKKEEKAIRKKLKDVSLIPEIEEDIRRLKLKIAGVDVGFLESQIDRKQDRKLRKLAAKERMLEKKAEKAEQIARRHELSKEEKQNIDKIPKLQKKTGFLNRLFKKESFDVNNLENRYNKDRLEFNERLAQELAESKRMIVENKSVIKQELTEALAETLKHIQKDKQESDKLMLEEIKKVQAKIEAEKKELNESMSQKIVQLKSRIEERENLAKFEPAEKLTPVKAPAFFKEKKVPITEIKQMPELPKFPKLKKEDLEKIEKIREKELGFKPLPELPPLEFHKKEKEKPAEMPEFPKMPLLKISEIEKEESSEMPEFPGMKPLHVTLHPHFKKLPSLPEKVIKPEVERTAQEHKTPDHELPSLKIEHFPRTLKLEHMDFPQPIKLPEMPREKILKKETVSKPHVMQRRVPRKAFIEQSDFLLLVDNLEGFKKTSSDMQDDLSRDFKEKLRIDSELSKCFDNLDKIRASLGKINSNFFKIS